MAGYEKFDPRLESLVVETRTNWAADLRELSSEEQATVARALQSRPQLATRIRYERTHTGFIREITVTQADLAQLQDIPLSLSGTH